MCAACSLRQLASLSCGLLVFVDPPELFCKNGKCNYSSKFHKFQLLVK